MKVGFLLGELLEHRRVHLSRGGGGTLDLSAGNEEEGRVQSLNWSSSSLMMFVSLSETFRSTCY